MVFHATDTGMRANVGANAAESRFRDVFSNLGAITAYARRRGSTDADAIAAETMTIAWRRRDLVPKTIRCLTRVPSLRPAVDVSARTGVACFIFL